MRTSKLTLESVAGKKVTVIGKGVTSKTGVITFKGCPEGHHGL